MKQKIYSELIYWWWIYLNYYEHSFKKKLISVKKKEIKRIEEKPDERIGTNWDYY